MGVAKLGDGDVDDEGDGEEHEADDTETGEQQLERAVVVTHVAVVAILLLYHEVWVQGYLLRISELFLAQNLSF